MAELSRSNSDGETSTDRNPANSWEVGNMEIGGSLLPDPNACEVQKCNDSTKNLTFTINGRKK